MWKLFGKCMIELARGVVANVREGLELNFMEGCVVQLEWVARNMRFVGGKEVVEGKIEWCNKVYRPMVSLYS